MPIPADLWMGTGIGRVDNGSVAVVFPVFVPMCLGFLIKVPVNRDIGIKERKMGVYARK